jgi:hypothetical protein
LFFSLAEAGFSSTCHWFGLAPVTRVGALLPGAFLGIVIALRPCLEIHAMASTERASTGAQPSELSESMLMCIQNCLDCHRACVQTFIYCTEQGGHHTEPSHLRLMLDVAQICQTSADFMLRNSPLHQHICAACADVCQACADDCGEMAEDLRMKACADTCQHCADACREMSRSAAPGGSRVKPTRGAINTRHKSI